MLTNMRDSSDIITALKQFYILVSVCTLKYGILKLSVLSIFISFFVFYRRVVQLYGMLYFIFSFVSVFVMLNIPFFYFFL